MPTPPKETIGGTRPRHIADHEFALIQYDYIVHKEDFITTPEFQAMDEDEQTAANMDIELQNVAYENLRLIVEDY